MSSDDIAIRVQAFSACLVIYASSLEILMKFVLLCLLRLASLFLKIFIASSG
jgi:hypothetical protein